MRNKKFETPTMTVIRFDTADVIAASGPLTVTRALFKTDTAEKLGTKSGDYWN